MKWPLVKSGRSRGVSVWKSPPSCRRVDSDVRGRCPANRPGCLAGERAVKLQPLSCGKNWGFGSDLPATDGVYILNLSALRRIRSLSLESHCADIEPGVTQGQLDAALEQEGGVIILMSLAPGLGQRCGNALERGIGYSGQRHLDLLDLEIVFPSGELARTSRFEILARPGAGLNVLGPDPTGLSLSKQFRCCHCGDDRAPAAAEDDGGVLCRLSRGDLMPDLISTISDLMAEGPVLGASHVQSGADCHNHVPAPELRLKQQSFARSRRALDGADSPTWVAGGFAASAYLESRLAPLGRRGPKQ